MGAKLPPFNIAVDAVEISGPSGTQWASDARASSDNSASASSYAPGSVTADTVQGSYPRRIPDFRSGAKTGWPIRRSMPL